METLVFTGSRKTLPLRSTDCAFFEEPSSHFGLEFEPWRFFFFLKTEHFSFLASSASSPLAGFVSSLWQRHNENVLKINIIERTMRVLPVLALHWWLSMSSYTLCIQDSGKLEPRG